MYSLIRYKLYYSSCATVQQERTVCNFPIILYCDDIAVRLSKSNYQSNKDEDFRLLVNYVDTLKEIFESPT